MDIYETEDSEIFKGEVSFGGDINNSIDDSNHLFLF